MNDIHDIDALGSTIPYCDFVVTDNAMPSRVHEAGATGPLNTVVLSRLADPPAHR